MLAHNEAARIEKTLVSLFRQDVFETFYSELVIVANGCTDATAAVARGILIKSQQVWAPRGLARVEEISPAGKTNAWNEFVNKFGSSQASVFVFVDADIEMLDRNAITSMINTLMCNKEAVICVDRAIKDIELKTAPSIFERLIVAATPKDNTTSSGLCGQLYCILSSEARAIIFPTEITVDDGFLHALLLTRGFTAPEDPKRIVVASNVAHSFKSVASFREVFSHEKWLISGNIVNFLLFERFWAEATPVRSAMTLMSGWAEQDPRWLVHYVESQVRSRGAWRILPLKYWTRRFSRLKGLSVRRVVQQFPIAALAAIMDAFIFAAAIRDVRRGRAFGYWARK